MKLVNGKKQINMNTMCFCNSDLKIYTWRINYSPEINDVELKKNVAFIRAQWSNLQAMTKQGILL